MELTDAQALALRMRSLLLGPGAGPDSVVGVVEWFGAMQAQDMASGLWSLGVRLPAFTLDDVNAALERREAIRTWPMRGTVHLVPPADAHWMLELTGVRMLAGAAKRRAVIGLEERDADRGVEVLATVLKGRRLTRAECLTALADAGIELARPEGLPPHVVREPEGRHLHRAARRQGADVRAAGRVGPRAQQALARGGAGHHRAPLLPRPRPGHPGGPGALDRPDDDGREGRRRRGG
nr:hypothetical protein GCM10020092_047950 [Actinoplanes digitatis]